MDDTKAPKEIEEIGDELINYYKQFRQFDIVTDPSDHYYMPKSSKENKPTKATTKAIHKELKILNEENNLPSSIFVRAYEERINLMRVCIVGSPDTPYVNGLFFFDIYFPNCYPNSPPKVYYHSHGLFINPNLHSNGKVCLSLLNTWWICKKREKWNPEQSTLLQVLVSLQALVLNAEPYFNEPGYEYMVGTPQGKKKSIAYNNEVFKLSCTTMLYVLRNPPKNFEDFVKGHFRNNAHSILMSCKVLLGCLGDDSSNELFRMVLNALEANGAYCKHFHNTYLKSKKGIDEPIDGFLVKVWKNLIKKLGVKT